MPLTHRELRAAKTCGQMIATANYKANLRRDDPEFVEAVSETVSQVLCITLDDARTLLVRKHAALIELHDAKASDVAEWLPPRLTTPRDPS